MAGQATNGSKTGIVINYKRHLEYNSTNEKNNLPFSGLTLALT
jgi:hypothetical protein